MPIDTLTQPMKLRRYDPAHEVKPGIPQEDDALRDMSGVINNLCGEALVGKSKPGIGSFGAQCQSVVGCR